MDEVNKTPRKKETKPVIVVTNRQRTTDIRKKTFKIWCIVNFSLKMVTSHC